MFGFLSIADLLLAWPVTGLLLRCRAAEILWRMFSVVNSGPIPGRKIKNASFSFMIYSKTCLKRPLKIRQNKDLNPRGTFCNTFNLH